MDRIEWNYYHMFSAKIASLRSSCNSRPGGAVIVDDNNRHVSSGMVGTVRGTVQCSDKGPGFCLRRSLAFSNAEKYNVCPSVHAEANAIDNSYRSDLRGCTMYCTLQPCTLCLKRIANKGIKKVYYELQYNSVDEKLDQIWLEQADNYGIECEKLVIPTLVRFKVARKIESITSTRKFRSI